MAKIMFLIILLTLTSFCWSQTSVTSGYLTIVSDPDYQNSPQIVSSLNFRGSNLFTQGSDFAAGSALIFLSNRQISDFSYTVLPNPYSRGWIQLDGLTCPNGYYANPNSNQSTRLDFAVEDFYIPKFYLTQKTSTVLAPFTMTGRISCFGNNTDNNPPYGTRQIIGSGTARFNFTRSPNSIYTVPSGKTLYLLTVQYEFSNGATAIKN